MRALLTIVFLNLSMSVLADEPARNSDAASAIDRGLVFLAKDAVAWKNEHNCVSCHHAGLVIWSMNEARLKGHAVDEPLLADLTTWVATSGDGRSSLPRPDGIPKALNTKALWFSLALSSVPEPNAEISKGLSLMLATVRSDQTESGAWAGWPESRAPMFGGSDHCMTALATMALLAAPEADTDSQAVREKAMQWLDVNPSDKELQTLAIRLMLASRLNRPVQERKSLVAALQQRQHADGGWSQTMEMPCDAWATGQSLYALAIAGVEPTHDSILRGQQFLIQSQRDDGSWSMTSRPTKSGSEGASYLVPITGAGSAWAVIGLSRSR